MKSFREIGGFFELELRKGQEFHNSAIRLNTARNALELILILRKYNKIYLPFYSCDAILEPIIKLKLDFEFYYINDKLEPIFNYKYVRKNEAFLVINYFGIKGKSLITIAKKCQNLIIDNSQAFFERPLKGIDTFYSPRKFIGVPDGSYLYIDKKYKDKLEEDISSERISHLVARIDLGAELAYPLFKLNEDLLSNQPIKIMSRLTHRVLQSIDYKYILKQRRANYIFLQKKLYKYNSINFDIGKNDIPMVFPFVYDKFELKKYLVESKIYIATYWPNIKQEINQDSIESYLCQNLHPLPIDQRYNEKDLSGLIKIIKKVVK